MAKNPSTKPQVTAEVLRARAKAAQAKAEALSYIADLDLSAEITELEHATTAEQRVTERIARARAELLLARERVAASEAAIRARVAAAVAVPGVTASAVAEFLGIPLRLCLPAQPRAEATGTDDADTDSTSNSTEADVVAADPIDDAQYGTFSAQRT